MGRSLHRNKNYAEAIPYFLKALEIEKQEVARDAVRVNSRVNLSFTWNDMGITQLARGEHAAALECFKEALKLREELVTSNPKDVRSASLLANTKLRIGMALAKLQRVREGLKWMDESLQSREQLAAKDPKIPARRARWPKPARRSEILICRRVMSGRRGNLQRAQGIFADLRSQGKLPADFRHDPTGSHPSFRNCAMANRNFRLRGAL